MNNLSRLLESIVQSALFRLIFWFLIGALLAISLLRFFRAKPQSPTVPKTAVAFSHKMNTSGWQQRDPERQHSVKWDPANEIYSMRTVQWKMPSKRGVLRLQTFDGIFFIWFWSGPSFKAAGSRMISSLGAVHHNWSPTIFRKQDQVAYWDCRSFPQRDKAGKSADVLRQACSIAFDRPVSIPTYTVQ